MLLPDLFLISYSACFLKQLRRLPSVATVQSELDPPILVNNLENSNRLTYRPIL